MTGIGVICDGCGAVAPPVLGHAIGNGSYQRQDAESHGWRCDETGDWCPICKEKRDA